MSEEQFKAGVYQLHAIDESGKNQYFDQSGFLEVSSSYRFGLSQYVGNTNCLKDQIGILLTKMTKGFKS